MYCKDWLLANIAPKYVKEHTAYSFVGVESCSLANNANAERVKKNKA